MISGKFSHKNDNVIGAKLKNVRETEKLRDRDHGKIENEIKIHDKILRFSTFSQLAQLLVAETKQKKSLKF